MKKLSSVFSIVLWVGATSINAHALVMEKGSPEANTPTSYFEKSQSTKVLGKALGADVTAGTPTDSSTVENTATLTVLGKSLEALSGTVAIPNTPDVPATGTVGSMEFYSFGKRVFSESFFESNTGILGGEIGLAPAEVRVPLVTYPVGPLLLEIDGGARFQAELQGHINPTIIFSGSGISNQSTIGVTLSGNALGAGFLEGYATLFVVRGGLGGQVDLINATLNSTSTFFFDGGKPVTSISAMAQFMSGEFYSFLDYFNILAWSWSNLWTDTLYSWNGVCFSTGSMTCP